MTRWCPEFEREPMYDSLHRILWILILYCQMYLVSYAVEYLIHRMMYYREAELEHSMAGIREYTIDGKTKVTY